jgi:hypothetical protein
MLNGGPIAWKSKLSPIVCTSSTDAEYVAACMASYDIAHLRQIMDCLGFPQTDPTPMYEDNQGCIALSSDPVFRDRTKHIDVRFHFLRERVRDFEVQLIKVTTFQQLADILTKPLAYDAFFRLQLSLMTPRDKVDACRKKEELLTNRGGVSGI